MKGKRIAILETRTGEQLARLIELRGGMVLHAPALAEVPDIDTAALQALLADWQAEPFGVVIFQTGVGTRALFNATDKLQQTAIFLTLLRAATIVVRGPKPVGELNARAVRIDIRAAAPFTTEAVLAALSSTPLQGVKVLLQRYGAPNPIMQRALLERGASCREIASYRWSLPDDTAPLNNLLEALEQERVDAVVFTSAVQMHNLHTVAQEAGCGARLAQLLQRTVVASIGPVCTRTLQEYGVTPALEASPPKLGPLLSALAAAWDARSLSGLD